MLTPCVFANIGCVFIQSCIFVFLWQLSLITDWEEDDDFPFQAPPTGDHCEISTTAEWLIQHGIEGMYIVNTIYV